MEKSAITSMAQLCRMPLASEDVSGNDEERWSALMVSAQSGNEPDYRFLLGELSVCISRYLYSRFGAHHFIEDCVQETLIAIHQARHTYDARRRFRPWLFAIVRHKAIDMFRRQRSQQQLATAQQELRMTDAAGQNISPMEEDLAQGQLLLSLSPQYREAITLTKIIGMSNAEAAARLSISEGAVKVRVHRAISKLKQLLEAETA